MSKDEPQLPKLLDEEQRHNAYSTDAAMNHYKNFVYYRQRKGGEGWFHGRVSNPYRQNYDQIDWRKPNG
jgi:hypothetical protein